MELHPTSVAALILLGLFAGYLGALIGLGGGIILTPVLALGFGVDLRVAVATSLFGVIATSSAASTMRSYTQFANMRLGVGLEIFTALGGISGSVLAIKLPQRILAITLSIAVTCMALLLSYSRKRTDASHTEGDTPLNVEGDKRQLSLKGKKFYLSGFVFYIVGIFSGLLGIGGGFIRVPTMTLVMGIPFKVAAATSNAMLGMTAAVSLVNYLANGFVRLTLVAPVVLGTIGGALLGASKLQHLSPRVLQRVLTVILLIVAIQLTVRAFGGGFDR